MDDLFYKILIAPMLVCILVAVAYTGMHNSDKEVPTEEEFVPIEIIQLDYSDDIEYQITGYDIKVEMKLKD